MLNSRFCYLQFYQSFTIKHWTYGTDLSSPSFQLKFLNISWYLENKLECPWPHPVGLRRNIDLRNQSRECRVPLSVFVFATEINFLCSFFSKVLACVNWTRRWIFPSFKDAAYYPAPEDPPRSLLQLSQEIRRSPWELHSQNRKHADRDCFQETLGRGAEEKAACGPPPEQVVPSATKEDSSWHIISCSCLR